MLENASDAVFAVGPEGNFVWLNMVAEQMFGYRYDELVGKPVSLLVPGALHDRHRIHMDGYLTNPEERRMGEHLATAAVHKDGKEFAIAASLGCIDTQNGQIVLCFVRDVSEAKALESYAGRIGLALTTGGNQSS